MKQRHEISEVFLRSYLIEISKKDNIFVFRKIIIEDYTKIYSIPSKKILLILRHQHLPNWLTWYSPKSQRQRWSHKHDGHYKKWFHFCHEIFPVIIEISSLQGNLSQQPYDSIKPYELLWQLNRQYVFIFLILQAVEVIWWDLCLQCTHANSFSSFLYLHVAWLYLLIYS